MSPGWIWCGGYSQAGICRSSSSWCCWFCQISLSSSKVQMQTPLCCWCCFWPACDLYVGSRIFWLPLLEIKKTAEKMTLWQLGLVPYKTRRREETIHGNLTESENDISLVRSIPQKTELPARMRRWRVLASSSSSSMPAGNRADIIQQKTPPLTETVKQLRWEFFIWLHSFFFCCNMARLLIVPL